MQVLFKRFTRSLLGALISSLLIMGANIAAHAADSTVVKRFNDWTVYKAKTKDGTLCFAASTPKDIEPKNVKRGDIFFYITTWPKFKVREEVSVKLGYPLKAQSTPSITIGAKNFTLYDKGERAYIHSSLENNLLAAMRAGSKMVIKGTSKRGTNTTDIYSLSGITAALKATKSACN